MVASPLRAGAGQELAARTSHGHRPLIAQTTSAARGPDAFEQAGLAGLLCEPDPGPGPRGRRRQIVGRCRCLVVRVEKADGLEPWHRNFQCHGLEILLTVLSPAELACGPNRGSAGPTTTNANEAGCHLHRRGLCGR